jgi:hypothetical protein
MYIPVFSDIMNVDRSFLIIIPILIVLSIVISGCTEGVANVTLDASYEVDSYDDATMTVTFRVPVTATNIGTMKARDLIVSVIMMQLYNKSGASPLQTSNISSTEYDFGTLDPGTSKTLTGYCTLEGREDTYQDLKNGEHITIQMSTTRLSYYSVPFLEWMG